MFYSCFVHVLLRLLFQPFLSLLLKSHGGVEAKSRHILPQRSFTSEPKLLKLKGRVQHALVEPHQGLKANGHGRNKAAIHYGPLGSNGLSDGVQIIRGQYVF